MKKCINRACNAELEDYQERCPNCGLIQSRIQSKDDITPSNKKMETESESTVERHGFITFWLWTIIVGNIIMAIIEFFPKEMWGSNYPDEYVVPSIISGFFSIINVVGAFVLLSWKREGYYIIAVSVVLGSCIAMIMTGALPIGIVGLMILWAVLQIKKNGVSYWKILE